MNVFILICKVIKLRLIALLAKCSIKCSQHNFYEISDWLFNLARKLDDKPTVHFCKWTVAYDNNKNIIGIRCKRCGKVSNL